MPFQIRTSILPTLKERTAMQREVSMLWIFLMAAIILSKQGQESTSVRLALCRGILFMGLPE